VPYPTKRLTHFAILRRFRERAVGLGGNLIKRRAVPSLLTVT
jgi:hypothetical protein